jgi:hypothetical protein
MGGGGELVVGLLGGAGMSGSGTSIGGRTKCAVGSVSESECDVAAAEVWTVDGTGPVSVSVVSESNDGDTESSVRNGLDAENSGGNGSSGDGGDDKGEDSADEVSVTKISGASSIGRSRLVIPDGARPRESVDVSTGLVGS